MGLNPTEADEVVQDTFILVSKKIPEFKAQPEFGRFKNWLLNLIRFRILDQLRKRTQVSQHWVEERGDSIRTDTVERIPDPANLDWQSLSDRAYQESILELAIEKIKDQVDPEQFQIFDLMSCANGRPLRWRGHCRSA